MRAIWVVLLIAVIDAVLLGTATHINDWLSYRRSLTWPYTFWVVSNYTFIIAITAGGLFAVPAMLFAEHMPKPRLRIFLVIGSIAGPIPLLILNANSLSVAAVVAFMGLGAFSATCWWHFMAKNRSAFIGTTDA